MAYPRKKEPEKVCAFCGKKMERKRFNGRLEDLTVFKRRKYCNQTCAGAANRKVRPTYSALLKRALPFRESTCGQCGGQDNLQIHHIDGNPANNARSNLMTLCASCHAKWHWDNGKVMPKSTDCCSVCGVPLQKSWRGMCQKHYQRYKKYGSPYLAKRRRGSQYVLVRID